MEGGGGGFVQMSLEALVIVETAAGAHGLSFKKHNVLKKHMSNMERPHREPSEFLTIILLGNRDFYWLACVIPVLFTTPVYLLHHLAQPNYHIYKCWHP